MTMVRANQQLFIQKSGFKKLVLELFTIITTTTNPTVNILFVLEVHCVYMQTKVGLKLFV